MSFVLGIDPGLDGALAWIGPDGKPARVATMPLLDTRSGGKRRHDRPALVDLILWEPVELAIIEQVGGGALPTGGHSQSGSAMFVFGQGYGLLLGMLTALRIPYQEVRPQTWKADILRGTAKDKQAAVAWCQGRYPSTSLLATPRCKVPHDGIADALCLATHGVRLLGRKEGAA